MDTNPLHTRPQRERSLGELLTGIGAWLAIRALRGMRSVRIAPQESLTELRTTQRWASEEAAELRSALANGQDGSRPAAGAAPVNRIRGVQPAPRAGAVATRAPQRGSRKETDGQQQGLLKTVVHEIQDDDIPGQAAKLAYYAFLALPPAVMAVFGLAGLFGSMDLARTIQQEASVALPASVNEAIVAPFIEQVVLNKAPGPFSIGLLLALWGGSSVFVGLMTTLNAAYDVEEDRSFVKKRAIALGVMLAAALLFLVSAAALLAGPQISGALGLGSTGDLIWALLQWPLAFAFMVAAFWLGYYVLPNRDQSACKKVLLRAAAAAALLWVVATAAFRLYIANFSSYSETYGLLGTFIVLLLWLYVTGLVVLAGGELASEMERR
jgi:membrane protein